MSVIEIREALPSDFEFITRIMEEALSPFYAGDHRAHAKRIFETHIAGGEDTVGHFSKEQRMWVITEDGIPAGMINIVGKRQATYKISPLIIDPTYQGRKGFGSRLLNVAEQYAQEHQTRQMYCTIAEQNNSALQFFLKKGYIVAGKSESHYKAGVTEMMLYKLFLDSVAEERFDRPNISVLPAEKEHEEQITALVLQKLPHHFQGIDNEWIEALFKGYERRDTRDVNVKYKLIFVAVDRNGTVLGVVGATPKKGEPIKLMPCTAYNIQAFTALLADVPQLLVQYGHKLYTHLVPSVEETVALQRLGWTLDAAMPGSYKDNRITQQWGYVLGEHFMRTMRVKQRFIDQIVKRQKTLEVRIGYGNIKKIRPGERIRLITHKSEQIIRVIDVRVYSSFATMLEHEDAKKIVPDSDKSKVLNLLKEIYPPDKEKLGVYVLEVRAE